MPTETNGNNNATNNSTSDSATYNSAIRGGYQENIFNKIFWFTRAKVRVGHWPFIQQNIVEDLTRVIPASFYGGAYESAKLSTREHFAQVYGGYPALVSALANPTDTRDSERFTVNSQERKAYSLISYGYNSNAILGKLRNSQVKQAGYRANLAPSVAYADLEETEFDHESIANLNNLSVGAWSDAWAKITDSEPEITVNDFINVLSAERKLAIPSLMNPNTRPANPEQAFDLAPPVMENGVHLSNFISGIAADKNEFDKALKFMSARFGIEIAPYEGVGPFELKMRPKRFFGALDTIKKRFSAYDNGINPMGWPQRFKLEYSNTASVPNDEKFYGIVKYLSRLQADQLTNVAEGVISANQGAINLPSTELFNENREELTNACACLIASELCLMMNLSQNDAKNMSETFKFEATQHLSLMTEEGRTGGKFMPILADIHAIGINNLAYYLKPDLEKYADNKGFSLETVAEKMGGVPSLQGVLYENHVAVNPNYEITPTMSSDEIVAALNRVLDRSMVLNVITPTMASEQVHTPEPVTVVNSPELRTYPINRPDLRTTEHTPENPANNDETPESSEDAESIIQKIRQAAIGAENLKGELAKKGYGTTPESENNESSEEPNPAVKPNASEDENVAEEQSSFDPNNIDLSFITGKGNSVEDVKQKIEQASNDAVKLYNELVKKGYGKALESENNESSEEPTQSDGTPESSEDAESIKQQIRQESREPTPFMYTPISWKKYEQTANETIEEDSEKDLEEANEIFNRYRNLRKGINESQENDDGHMDLKSSEDATNYDEYMTARQLFERRREDLYNDLYTTANNDGHRDLESEPEPEPVPSPDTITKPVIKNIDFDELKVAKGLEIQGYTAKMTNGEQCCRGIVYKVVMEYAEEQMHASSKSQESIAKSEDNDKKLILEQAHKESQDKASIGAVVGVMMYSKMNGRSQNMEYNKQIFPEEAEAVKKIDNYTGYIMSKVKKFIELNPEYVRGDKITAYKINQMLTALGESQLEKGEKATVREKQARGEDFLIEVLRGPIYEILNNIEKSVDDPETADLRDKACAGVEKKANAKVQKASNNKKTAKSENPGQKYLNEYGDAQERSQ